MGDRGTAIGADYEALPVTFHRNERLMVKIAGVAEVGLDKNDRNVISQPMSFANLHLLDFQLSPAGSVRHEHGKLEHLEALPQEPRLRIGKAESQEAQL